MDALGPDLGQAEKATGTRGATKVAPYKPEPGRLYTVTAETPDEETGENLVQLSLTCGTISADLTTGAAINMATPLLANEGLSFMGVTLVGDFTISPADLTELGLTGKNKPAVVKSYLIGKDLAQVPRGVDLIDFFGLEEGEARSKHPKLFERVLKVVKPLREQNKRDSYRKKWWVFGEPRTAMRAALADLPRFIATPETSKHRFFIFVPSAVVLDHSAFAFATSDAFHLGVLSSRIHVVYSLAAGGTLEDRPRYRNAGCFDPFPFPDCTETQKERIRKLAEELEGCNRDRLKTAA